jgi:hypothetical protein
LSKSEFRENLLSERHALIKGVNEMLSIFSAPFPLWLKFGTVDGHNKLLNDNGFRKLRLSEGHTFHLYLYFATAGRAVQVVAAREIPSSISGRVLGNFQVPYSFYTHSVALGSTQPLTKMSTKEFTWGHS